MKLDDIIGEWKKDSVIDRYKLTEESLCIPMLHSKYYEIFLNEKRVLVDNQEKFKNFEYVKFLYYQGKLPSEEIKRRGWDIFNLSILKSDLKMVIDGDTDVIEYKIKISEQAEKVKFVEDILKSIHQRTFMIKNAVEYERFITGA
jgi:hypothetical protein